VTNDNTPGTQARAIREDIFTTLAIATLLHDDNHTIQQVAANLAKRAPGSLRKKTLLPLSESRYAREILLESATFPTQDLIIGSAEHDGTTYDIEANWRHTLDFTVGEVIGAVADILIQRGLCDGRVYVSIIDPVYRGMRADSVLLPDHAKYSVQNYDGIQQEA
jgi:hypothetical protein